MYKIYIKGTYQPIELNDEVGKSISNDYRLYRKTKQNDKVIEAGGNIFNVSDIRAIVVGENTRTDSEKKNNEQQKYKHLCEHHFNNYYVRNKTPEERSKQTAMWGMVFVAFVGRLPDENDEKVFAQEQLKYFIENPNEAYAPLFLVKDYIDRKASEERIVIKENTPQRAYFGTATKLAGVAISSSKKMSVKSKDEHLNIAKYYFSLLDDTTKYGDGYKQGLKKHVLDVLDVDRL